MGDVHALLGYRYGCSNKGGADIEIALRFVEKLKTMKVVDAWMSANNEQGHSGDETFTAMHATALVRVECLDEEFNSQDHFPSADPVLCQYSAGAEMAHGVRNSWPGKKRMGVDFGRDPAHMMDEGPRRVGHKR